jgi:hypothetical protein
VIEQGEHIVAEVAVSRVWTRGGTSDVTHGAQEASRTLRHEIDVRCR